MELVDNVYKEQTAFKFYTFQYYDNTDRQGNFNTEKLLKDMGEDRQLEFQ